MTARPVRCGYVTGGAICGAVDGLRLYLTGWLCALHGAPEPATAYCAPARCYCGNPDCPAYPTFHLRDRYASHLDAWQVIDARHIASGKRRSSPQQYAAARAAVDAQKTRHTQRSA
jgi:hypothetical protein